MNQTDLIALGMTAMRAGDHAEAANHFRVLCDRTPSDPRAWLMLGQCAWHSGDLVEAEAAFDTILTLAPHDMAALLMKGECRARNDDLRAAVTFWGHVLTVAEAQGHVPENLTGHIDALPARIAQARADFRAHIDQQLGSARDSLPRIAEALDLMDGKREIYFQSPISFYFPGLPQIQFYDPGQFEWATEMEAATDRIRDELENFLAKGEAIVPYMRLDAHRPSGTHPLLNDARWGAIHLWNKGKRGPGMAEAFPNAMAMLERVPMPHIAMRSPMALFSVLEARTHIEPHNGLLNTRLICHLPLIVPPDCRLRVGNEIRQVKAGKLMIFDDSIDHEAWNDSDERRVVLLFEIWRPEITPAERQALTSLFEAVSLL